MTATAHALVAGALASKFGATPLSATLAFLSHYMMDSIPHWDFGTNWRNRPKRYTALFAVGETIAAIALSYVFFGKLLPFPHWAITVSAALLPDWAEVPWYTFFARQDKHAPAKHATLAEHIAFRLYKLQNVFHTKTHLPLGIATQVITVVFFLLLLKNP